MAQHYDALIIGGGVNGCSIAYQLSKKGYKTAVLERNMVAAESSSAAAGMLGAQVEFKTNDAFFQFACKSREMFPDLINELEQLTGMRAGYIENGMLKVADSEAEADRLLQMKKVHEEAEQEVYWWDRQQVQEREPGISEDVIGALYIPKDGQVKANQLTIALSRAAVKLGAKLYEFTEVLSLIESENKVTGVKTDRGNIYADHVIIASGVWSTRVADYLPMIPVKGEILSLRPEEQVISRTIHGADFYIVPKIDGSLYIGATEKEGTFHKKVTAGGMHELLGTAQQLVPELKEAAFEAAWSGVRPQTADGKPYIGNGEKEGLWVAAGHYRNGILLSAITGKWITDLIDGKSEHPDWEAAFSPMRLKGEKKLEVNY